MTAEFEGLVFIVIYEDPLSRTVETYDGEKKRIRADFKVCETHVDAVSRQLELGKLNGKPSWLMSFPDPRRIANV